MPGLRPALYTLREIASTRGAMRASLSDLRLQHDGLEPKLYVERALEWLCRAQDVASDGGVSYGFDVRKGWLPPYPETTGYIITTFLDYATHAESLGQVSRADDLRERAKRMAHWLITMQMRCGALPGGTTALEPVATVFNTGQVLEGWCNAHRAFKDQAILDSLIQAARWLVSSQDQDGCWRKAMSPLTVQTPATYNVRTAAALLNAGELLDEPKFREAAVRNFDWALTQQRENGWFDNNCLTDHARPLTHTIGYTLEALLEAGRVLDSQRYVSAVLKTTAALKGKVTKNGFLSGRFDSNWRSTASWCCLTGSSQIAMVWFRLGHMVGNDGYREPAARLLSFVKRTQRVTIASSPNSQPQTSDGISGGIKGSHPIWGGYDPFRYPNWAAKFFIDALLASGF
jgi:squalene-hopene cyclase-like protein